MYDLNHFKKTPHITRRKNPIKYTNKTYAFCTFNVRSFEISRPIAFYDALRLCILKVMNFRLVRDWSRNKRYQWRLEFWDILISLIYRINFFLGGTLNCFYYCKKTQLSFYYRNNIVGISTGYRRHSIVNTIW